MVINMAWCKRFVNFFCLLCLLLSSQASWATARFVIPETKGVSGYGVVLPVFIEGEEVISFGFDLVFDSRYFSADPALLAARVNLFANHNILDFGPHYNLSYESLVDRLRIIVSPAPGTVIPDDLSLDEFNRIPRETTVKTEARIKPGLVMYIPINIKAAAADHLGLHVLSLDNVVVGGVAKNEVVLSTHSIGGIVVEADADGDGLSNGFESEQAGGTTTSILADDDLDGDTLTNIEEYLLSTNPLLANTDNDINKDGLPCNDDVDAYPTDPDECYDFDNDGIGDEADTDDDNDGLSDFFELAQNSQCEYRIIEPERCFNSQNSFDLWADFDEDGLRNIIELKVGTLLNNPDTDQDAVYDGIDVFPLDFAEYADSNWDGVGDNAEGGVNNNGLPITSWVKSFKIISGTVDLDKGSSANDIDDNIIVSGNFNGEIEFHSDPTPGQEVRRSADSDSAFLTKLNSSGEFQWTRVFTAPAGDVLSTATVHNIFVDHYSNIYVSGGFSGTIHFPASGQPEDDVIKNSNAGSGDAFLIKYNRFGELVWLRHYGGSADDFVSDVTVDRDLNVYFTGEYRDSVAIGATTLNAVGGSDIVVSKLDYQGEMVWATSIGDTANNSGRTIQVHASGVVYVGGSEDAIQLNTETGDINWRYSLAGAIKDVSVMNEGDLAFASDSGFVGRVDKTNGEKIWVYSTTPATGSPIAVHSLNIGRDDRVTVTGWYGNGIADPFDDSNTIVGLNSYDGAGIVIRYTGDGVPEWYRSADSLGIDLVDSAISMREGGHVVVGYAESDLNLTPETQAVTSGESIFIAKFKQLHLEKVETPFELVNRIDLGNREVIDMHIDETSGEIYVTGGHYDYLSGPVLNQSIVAKYNSQGQLLWEWAVGVNPNIAGDVRIYGSQIVVDANNDVYVAGHMSVGYEQCAYYPNGCDDVKYALDFNGDGIFEAGTLYGSNTIESVVDPDQYFVVKINATGAQEWALIRPWADGRIGTVGELLPHTNGGVYAVVDDLINWCLYSNGIENCGSYSQGHFCVTDRVLHINNQGACQWGNGVTNYQNVDGTFAAENERLVLDAAFNPKFLDYEGAAYRPDGKLVTIPNANNLYGQHEHTAGIEIRDPLTETLIEDKSTTVNIFGEGQFYAPHIDTDSQGNTYRAGRMWGKAWDFNSDQYIDLRPSFHWWSLENRQGWNGEATNRPLPELVIHQYTHTGEYTGFAAFDGYSFPSTNTYKFYSALEILGNDDIYLAEGQYINVLRAKTNHAPEAFSAGFYTTEDVPVQGTVTGSDPNGDVLTFTLVSQPTLGVFDFDAMTGNFTYTPNENESGADLFSYKVSDGEFESSIVTSSIFISAVNDVHTLESSTYYTSANVDVTGQIDSHDVERDLLLFSVDSDGLLGTLSFTDVNKGEFVYTPNANTTGIDTVVIRAVDANLVAVNATLTINISLDTDGDGISDELDSDDDNDGLNDSWEISFLLNPLNADSDGDGLDDGYEIRVLGTDALNIDSDGDGMPDGWEQQYSLKPLDPSDADNDPDSDGINNLIEYQIGTDPHIADSDGDGIPDGWEYQYGLNPLNIVDGTEDPDLDGLDNLAEYQNGTHPFNADSDGDNVNDGDEVTLGRNPTVNEAVVIQILNELLLEE